MKYIVIIISCLLINLPAQAEIKVFSDPAYIEAGASNPLQSLHNMAKKGDARALYIMGDLYGKGKGGYSKNSKKAYKMFVKSAKQNYSQSMIRLAAIEKRNKNYSESYKWYALAVKAEEHKPSKKILKVKLKSLKKEMDKEQLKQAKIALKKWKKGDDNQELASKKGENNE